MNHTAIRVAIILLSSMVIMGANLAPIQQQQSYAHFIKHIGGRDLNGIDPNYNSDASSSNSNNNNSTTTMSHSALKALEAMLGCKVLISCQVIRVLSVPSVPLLTAVQTVKKDL